MSNIALAVPPGVQPSHTGIRFTAEISFDEWAALGSHLATMLGCFAWAVGDWLVYGQDRWQPDLPGMPAARRGRVSDDLYEQALAALPVDKTTLYNYAYVARRVAHDRRTTALSWDHHRIMAKLAPEEQSRWIELATGEKISTRRLRASVNAGRVVSTDEIRQMAGKDSHDNYVPHLNRLVAWMRKIIDHGTPEQRDALRRDIGAVVELAGELDEVPEDF
jgi:hypothetical protein